MAYSDNFPATRPVFMADFANGGKIDPRATFSRASTGSYFGTEKVLSSENLVLYSDNFSLWGQSGLASRTSGQTDPAAGSTGYTLLENSDTGFHRVYQNATATGSLAFTVFGKQNSGTRYLSLTLFNANNDWVAATFDLGGSAPATSSGSSSTFSGLTATQTASGNGYYKCVIKATGSIIAVRASLNNANSAPTGTYGLPSYTGDGSSSIDTAFSSLSTTGATDYNYTNGQVARSYQTKLQTAASGAARFEHSATDGQSAGTSLGILVEGQSTNLFTYSSDIANAAWTKTGTTATAEAIGPDGQLSAFAVREDTTTGWHKIAQAATVGSGSVAFSVYAKLLGNTRRLVLREDTTSGDAAVFDLSTGTVAAEVSGATGSIEAVGNGFYRCTMVCTPGAGSKSFGGWVVSSTATNYETGNTGDGFSGLLLAMPQVEDQSFASSYIATTSSSATRAADSLSMTDASLFNTGTGGLVVEAVVKSLNDGVAAWLGTDGNNYHQVGQFGSTTYPLISKSDGVASAVLSSAAVSTGAAHKVGASWSTDDFAACVDGGTVVADTSGTLPAVNKLTVGNYNAAAAWLDGTIKRVLIYSEALSDTNLQSLTAS